MAQSFAAACCLLPADPEQRPAADPAARCRSVRRRLPREGSLSSSRNTGIAPRVQDPPLGGALPYHPRPLQSNLAHAAGACTGINGSSSWHRGSGHVRDAAHIPCRPSGAAGSPSVSATPRSRSSPIPSRRHDRLHAPRNVGHFVPHEIDALERRRFRAPCLRWPQVEEVAAAAGRWLVFR